MAAAVRSDPDGARAEPVAAAGGEDADRWVAARVGADGFRTEIETRTHGLVVDEPRSLGGTDRGPTPYELLLGALGSCMAMTMRLYADRKGWPLGGVEVRLRTARSHEADCEVCDVSPVGITRVERAVELAGSLSEEQRRRVLEIADRCPVKQTLQRGIQVVDVDAASTA